MVTSAARVRVSVIVVWFGLLAAKAAGLRVSPVIAGPGVPELEGWR